MLWSLYVCIENGKEKCILGLLFLDEQDIDFLGIIWQNTFYTFYYDS